VHHRLERGRHFSAPGRERLHARDPVPLRGSTAQPRVHRHGSLRREILEAPIGGSSIGTRPEDNAPAGSIRGIPPRRC